MLVYQRARENLREKPTVYLGVVFPKGLLKMFPQTNPLSENTGGDEVAKFKGFLFRIAGLFPCQGQINNMSKTV